MGTPTLFSQWIRTNLKDAYSGLIVQDIDFILEDKKGNYFVVEEKYYPKARTGPAQAIIYKLIDDELADENDFSGCFKLTVCDENLNDVYLNNDVNNKINFEALILDSKRFSDKEWYKKIIKRFLPYLWDGKGTPPYHKTELERSFSRESKLQTLIQKGSIFSGSIDWLFVNFVSGYFVILSERDEDYNLLEERFINGFDKFFNKQKGAYNEKSKVYYQYLGNYAIEYNDSMTIFKINNYELNKEDFIRVMNLDTNEILNYLD